MVIERLEVKGFGKLNDCTAVFRTGINMVYGQNEAGKSTLQYFIKAMLYGLKGSKAQEGQLSALKRFAPWNGGRYAGALVYTLQNGSRIRVERDFDKGTAEVYDGSYNRITDSFAIGRDKLPAFAEKHLGLDETAFERTVFIRQSGIRIDGDGARTMAGKLANAGSSGSEEISLGKAEKALTDALKNNVGTGRTTKQPLDRLEEALRQMEASRTRLLEQREKRRLTVVGLKEQKELYARYEAEKQVLTRMGRLLELRRSLDAGLKVETGLKEASRALERMKEAFPEAGGKALLRGQNDTESGGILTKTGTNLTEQADSILKRPRKHRSQIAIKAAAFCFASALFMILSAVYLAFGGLTRVPRPLFPALCVLAAAFAAIGSAAAINAHGTLAADRQRKAYAEDKTVVDGADAVEQECGAGAGNLPAADPQALIQNICAGASLLFGKRLETREDVKDALEKTAAGLEESSKMLQSGIEAAEALTKGFEEPFGTKWETMLYDSPLEELETVLARENTRVDSAMMDAALKRKYAEGLLKDAEDGNEELSRLEEEIAASKENVAKLQFTGRALKLAHEVLMEAGLEMKRTFAPRLDSGMSSVIAGLTEGKYRDLRGDDKLSLRVAEPESGDIKTVYSLSGATTDQMYLALRLALADIFTDGWEELPLLLDEVFSQLDDNRTELALKYLHNTYEKGQVLIFTCKQREVELARKIFGSGLNLVEM